MSARRAAKVDANQREIVTALRQYPGVSVACLHMVGAGFADIVVGFRGANYLFELKGRRKAAAAAEVKREIEDARTGDKECNC